MFFTDCVFVFIKKTIKKLSDGNAGTYIKEPGIESYNIGKF